MIVYTSIITVRQEKLRLVFFVSKCMSLEDHWYLKWTKKRDHRVQKLKKGSAQETNKILQDKNPPNRITQVAYFSLIYFSRQHKQQNWNSISHCCIHIHEQQQTIFPKQGPIKFKFWYLKIFCCPTIKNKNQWW